MFHSRDVIQLKDDERVEGIFRRHFFALWSRLLFAGFFIVLPFFFLFALLSLGAFGVMLLVLFVGFGMYFAFKSFIQWDARVLLLTNHRLVHVHQKGAWSRKVFEVSLVSVREITCEKRGVKDWICRTASLSIVSSGSASDIRFSFLPRYKKFMQRINALRENLVRRVSVNDIR